MRPSALLLALLCGSAAQAQAVTVPVDFGVGPAAYYFFGPLNEGRWPKPHLGLKLDVQAVIDKDWMAQNRQAIPSKYRQQSEQLSEVRISPSVFIPDALIISPKLPALGDTGIYGISWRPLALGVPLAGRKRAQSWQRSRGHIDLEAGLVVTYAFIHSDTLGVTHFARPGIDLALEVELEVTRSFLVGLGWSSTFYVPQKVGTFGFGPLNESIFHVGQGFLQLHFRVPRKVNL